MNERSRKEDIGDPTSSGVLGDILNNDENKSALINAIEIGKRVTASSIERIQDTVTDSKDKLGLWVDNASGVATAARDFGRTALTDLIDKIPLANQLINSDEPELGDRHENHIED